jgi:PGF-CTERM protein
VGLDLSAALTNEGDESTSDLEVTFTVRQAESNVVADRVTADVGDIRAGRTSTVDAAVTVPEDYNYYVDAVLWRDDVHVDSAQSVANLDPTERISADETETDVAFEASDFESESERDDGRAEYDSGESTAEETPGFGVAIGVVALHATALFDRRRSK